MDAVGSSRKKMLNNVEYDYVFDIDIGDGIPPLKLPYNVTGIDKSVDGAVADIPPHRTSTPLLTLLFLENPYQVAQTFIDQNELPQGYLDQIANFIVTNAKGNEMTLGAPAPSLASSVDPFTGGSRYVPQGVRRVQAEGLVIVWENTYVLPLSIRRLPLPHINHPLLLRQEPHKSISRR